MIIIKRIFSLLICLILLVGVVTSVNFSVYSEAVVRNENIVPVKSGTSDKTYSDYLKNYKKTVSTDILLYNGVMHCEKNESFRCNVNVPDESWYCIEITYKAAKIDTGEISFGLLLDDKYPFKEAEQYTLPRLYEDSGEVRKDGIGNEFAAVQKEVYLQQTVVLSSAADFSAEASLFFFSEGTHSVVFSGFTAGVEILGVKLTGSKNLLKYKKLSDGYGQNKYYDGSEILIEGEDALYKSSYDLVAKSDSTTASVYPNDPFKQKVNYIGANWSDIGEEITWKIDVKESALYKLSFHYRQNYILNGNSYRNLKIDGETPFEEAKMITFGYGSGWQMYTLSDNESNPCLIFLEAGEHTLSLSVTLGSLSDFCTRLENTVYELGEWYRQMVMITGETPDSNRDYNLFSQIPNFENGLKKIINDIDELSGQYETLTGERGGSTVSILKSMKNTLNSMLKYKYKAQRYKSNYYSNYSSISAALYELMDMPLDIDTIVLSAPERKVEKGIVPITKKAAYSVQRFLASFVVDYNNISGNVDSDKKITLWINWGRDQAQTLNALIQSEFVPKFNTEVSVKITNASLVQGILSGNSPDCVLQHGRSEPVNLAMRGAAYDLSTFKDYNQVISRFAKGAVTPYEYKSGVYGLPDTQSFLMLFVRTDIFEEMGLTIPSSWEQFISDMKILSGSNLKTGIVSSSNMLLSQSAVASRFNMFLAQYGGNLYNKELNATELLTTSAISSFEFYTGFFTKYGCPKSYNFYNYFRTGLMAMGIEDYSMYATLKATAPEIDNRWTMVPVPGRVNEDGTINNLTNGGGTACMIMKDSVNPDTAWEFLKWWTEAETQYSYIQSLESVLGIAGRVATSNIEAASKLTWDGECFENLKKQWQNVNEFNEIPGSYYITRVIDQAYWNVVENNENPRDMLYRWSIVADKEISKKIKQYEQ